MCGWPISRSPSSRNSAASTVNDRVSKRLPQIHPKMARNFCMRKKGKKPHSELVSPQRSALMSRVRGKNTKPELAVRKLVHGLGYRFRLHVREMAGRPDLVLPRYRKVIFVNGCFWHRHRGCGRTTNPKLRAQFWREKFKANVARDAKNYRKLRRAGWRTLVVWECETFSDEKLRLILKKFLEA